jgi:hypothetical protein
MNGNKNIHMLDIDYKIDNLLFPLEININIIDNLIKINEVIPESYKMMYV